MIRLLPFCAALLISASALAQDGPEAAPVSDEFVRLFSTYCLQKFPDDAALSAQAGADMHQPLSDAEVKSFLHADPGVGWLAKGADSRYVITVEQPPYHACAVRRYSDQVLDGAPLIAAGKVFAAAQGKTLAPPLTRARPIGSGIISNAMLFQLHDAHDLELPEAFMFFVVSYPAVPKPGGSESKPFYDIRFVRQIFVKEI